MNIFKNRKIKLREKVIDTNNRYLEQQLHIFELKNKICKLKECLLEDLLNNNKYCILGIRDNNSLDLYIVYRTDINIYFKKITTIDSNKNDDGLSIYVNETDNNVYIKIIIKNYNYYTLKYTFMVTEYSDDLIINEIIDDCTETISFIIKNIYLSTTKENAEMLFY